MDHFWSEGRCWREERRAGLFLIFHFSVLIKLLFMIEYILWKSRGRKMTDLGWHSYLIDIHWGRSIIIQSFFDLKYEIASHFGDTKEVRNGIDTRRFVFHYMVKEDTILGNSLIILLEGVIIIWKFVRRIRFFLLFNIFNR